VVEETLNDVCRAEKPLIDGERKPRKKKKDPDATHDKPVLLVFNKVDAYQFVPKAEDDLSQRRRENISLDELKSTWMARMNQNCLFISARTGAGVDELKEKLYSMVQTIHTQRFPYNDYLFQKYDDLMEEGEESAPEE
jgi:GTP-binding protein HflX